MNHILLQRVLLPAAFTVSLPVLANHAVTGVADFNVESDIYRLEVGALLQNFTATGELALNGKERRREFLMAKVVYDQPLTDTLFVESELSFGTPLGNNDWRTLNGQDVRPSNLWKVGVKLGWDSLAGPYSNVRLRYDHGCLTIRAEDDSKDIRKLLRTDFTIGYRFSKINVSGNWVHQRSTDSAFRFGNGNKDTDSLEVKLSYQASINFVPYLQYNFRDQIYDDQNQRKSDDSLKIGLYLTF